MNNNFILIIALAISGCSEADTQRYEYYSDDMSTMMIMQGNRGYIGANPAAPNVPGKEIDDLGLLTDLRQPEITGGRCVAYSHFAFGIKNEMNAGDTFQCNGVTFKIEGCSSEIRPCSSFIISAYCGEFREGTCRPTSEPDESEPFYTYLYDSSRGLLSVNFAPGAPGDTAVLKIHGEQGFLL